MFYKRPPQLTDTALDAIFEEGYTFQNVRSSKMSDAYNLLEDMRKRYISRKDVDIKDEFLHLLSLHDIKPRGIDGGELKQINSSIPKSINNAFVIGLRYLKENGTYTEDHFLCRIGIEPGIEKSYYKRRLEYKMPEYWGTHKYQGPFDTSNTREYSLTQVNTISYWIR